RVTHDGRAHGMPVDGCHRDRRAGPLPRRHDRLVGQLQSGQDRLALLVTGLIARVEEDNPDYGWEDIAGMLEDHGFEPVEFILGPALD
ncbi:MAG: hypothetical protein R3308_09770, partial [Thiohalobacterales bacterium]|nr:hypothetical protein [Thiohalobacterales bacterium]